MDQSPQAARQTIADFAKGIGASELTEPHGNELGPAGKALGITLGGVLLHQRGKLRPREVLEQLIEQARDLYDWIALLWAACGEAPAKELLATVNYRRALLLFQTARTCFGQEWSGMASILAAVSQGQITPMEGDTLSRILERQTNVIATQDLERRVDDLELGSCKTKTTRSAKRRKAPTIDETEPFDPERVV